MKLIYEIILFPLINKLSLYLILNLLGEVFIRGQCLKGGVGGGGPPPLMSKLRKYIISSYKTLFLSLSAMKIKPKNLKTKKNKK